MIKFFRKIRKSFLEQNKMGKYFKYAIGEIILVVIGILIALQINIWNEQRKENSREKALLKELKQGLQSNLSILENRKLRFKDYISKTKKLINHLETKQSYQDSLEVHFFIPVANYSFGISYATFENLKSIGLDIISDKDLRLNLVKLYEEEYWILKDQETKMSNMLTNATIPFTRKYFRMTENGYKPFNYNKLLNNVEYLSILYESYYVSKSFYELSIDAAFATNKVIKKIDKILMQ